MNGATDAAATLTPRPVWACADAYLFDIDGTLLNVRDAVHYFAFQRALADVFGLAGAKLEGVPIHGNTDTGILHAVLRRAGVAEAEIARLLPRAVRQMCDEVEANAAGIRAEICPSIRELLERLRLAGKLLGVVSGNFSAIGWAKLRATGLRDYLAFGCYSDRLERRADIFREGIAEAQLRLGPAASICVVGDTPADVEAARETGIAIIAVSTGIYPAGELAPLAPDLCIASCAAILHEF